ncbi:MAG: YceI family protein [Myxococcota bacterium]
MKIHRTTSFALAALMVLGTLVVAPASASAAEKYETDPAHTFLLFRAKHLGAGYAFGQFLEVSGEFTYDEDDVSKSKVEFEAKADSVFTNNKKRDDHLKSPDFLNARQFPVVSFESKKVEAAGDDEYSVTGDLKLHGVTKEITITVEMTGTGKSPQGNFHRGFLTEFTIDRTDFGMEKLPGAVGNDIRITLAAEGIRQ